MDIDGAPDVAFEAGVEEAGRVLERGALGEGQLHGIVARPPGRDYSIVPPTRTPEHRVGGLPPFPLLDHVGVGLFDERSAPSERLAPPISELLDSRVDQPGGRVFFFSLLRAALSF